MSPITRETLVARIAALEAEKDISIKEAFYLKTMRLLLAEIDKPQPHHNGMMQLSNELAGAKAALRRLSAYARTFAGNIQYTGYHPIAVAEKIAGRDEAMFYGCSATDEVPRQYFGNSEQLDTAPSQFESLAGEPVSQRYTLPANTVCKDAPEHIWLQTAGVWPESGEFRELTWCSSNQHEDDTLYVRADVVTGNSPVIPDGWVLVPVEPTAEMQSAAAGAIRFDTTPINKLWTGNAVYRAMLAAAPQQEVKS